LKKIKTLLIVGLLIFLLLITMRTCERARLMKGLDVKAGKLDVLLDKEKHDNPDELMNALDAYLKETSFVMNNQGLLFVSYLSGRHKQIVFDNASKRLMKVKNMLLTNPSFYTDELPDLRQSVNHFYEIAGMVSYRNKDQEVTNLLKRWFSSGEIQSIYITKDELEQHSLLVRNARQMAEENKWKKIMANKKQEKILEPDTPGWESVQRMKQREVTRVTNVTIPYEKLDHYLGQKLTFLLKSGRQIKGECAAADAQTLSIGFNVEGNYFVKKVARAEVERIEEITVEKKLESYDPSMESDAKLRPDFMEMELLPYPNSRGFMGFITTDNKMYFVSTATGALLCHSPKNNEGYKPMATRIKANWDRDFLFQSTYEKPFINNTYRQATKNLELSQVIWNNPFTDPAFAHNDTKLICKEPNRSFNFVFELRLVKDVPGASTPIAIYCNDVVLNKSTIRVMFDAQSVKTAISTINNPRYGKGEHPWEYVLLPR
jgi:hypothetical protein